MNKLFRALCDAHLISADRLRAPLFSMGAYLYSGGPTHINWRK